MFYYLALISQNTKILIFIADEPNFKTHILFGYFVKFN